MLCISVVFFTTLQVLNLYTFCSVIVICHFNIELTEAGVMHEGMSTLSGAPSTTSLIGYYHLSVFGLLHFITWGGWR